MELIMGGGARRGRGSDRGSAWAAKAMRQARGAQRDRTRLWVGGVVLALLVGVIMVGAAVSGRSLTAPASVPVVRIVASYPVDAEGGVVVAGKPAAPTVVDVYEDFLCPACGLFEARHRATIEQALDDGRIVVRYHPVNLLDELSRPPGYSLEAANAAICAAEARVYPSYHASLFAAQPKEGGTGYPQEALASLGGELGAGGGFEQCVRSGAHDGQVLANLAGADAALRSLGGFRGTPTVLVNETPVDVLGEQGSARFDRMIGGSAG
jgi:protein-disulfide isomerase